VGVEPTPRSRHAVVACALAVRLTRSPESPPRRHYIVWIGKVWRVSAKAARVPPSRNLPFLLVKRREVIRQHSDFFDEESMPKQVPSQ